MQIINFIAGELGMLFQFWKIEYGYFVIRIYVHVYECDKTEGIWAELNIPSINR